jgi:uncharacterized protein YjbI with pentapeptide repeats
MLVDIPLSLSVTAKVSIIAGGTAAVVAWWLWWLWWRLPKRQAENYRLQIRDAKARADIEDAYRRTIGQLIGGVAVLIGAGFAYYQFLDQQDRSQKQLKATYDQLNSQQVAKGFEQLGSKELPVRIGGIYALEYVMNTSEQYHRPVLEALCAFVRDGMPQTAIAKPLRVSARKDAAGANMFETPVPANDIQAALAVIGRRGEKDDDLVDLVSANIQNTHLEFANLSGADLEKANLSGAVLDGANLSGSNFEKADLTAAHLIRADLSNSQFQYARMKYADFSDADLDEADLSYTKARLIHLDGAFLRKADLRGSDLSTANIIGAYLGEANLGVSALAYADSDHPNLRETHSDYRTNLQFALLVDSYLGGANLTGADLTGANCGNADLTGADLTDAILDGAELEGATLNEAKVSQHQLDRACGDEKTKLPKGLTIRHCPSKNRR